MAFQLVITVQGEPERIESLPDGDYLIGRSRSAHIHLFQPDVSGKHLMLHVDGESVIAENLSSHGARTTETVIELPTPLRSGDTVFLGKRTALTLRKAADEPAAPEPAPAPASEQTVVDVPPPAPAPVPAPEPEPPAPVPEQTVVDAPPPVMPEQADLDKTIIDAPPVMPEQADLGKTIIDAPPVMPEQADLGKTIIDAPEVDSAKTVIKETILAAGMSSAEAEQTTPSASDAADAELKTNVMQTRIASPEEIEFLRRQDRKRRRGKKLQYILGIAVLIVLLAAVYLFRGKAPEEKLSWPLTADGSYAEKLFDPPGGGVEQGRFSVVAPLADSTAGEVMKNGDLVITTRAGRDRDVPLRIVLSVKRSAAYLHEERLQTFRNWIAEISAGGGHWNFGQVSDLFFLGKNNGLPCLEAVYSREAENQSWYGAALFFRNGAERVVRRVEIPSSERVRGAEFLSSEPFLLTSEALVENHWEGAPHLDKGNPGELLNEAKGLLVKMSPATWDKIALLLRTALCAAAESGDRELQARALEQLRKLRGQQRVWYNAQCIAWLKEKNAGNENGANIIRDSCLSVFSSADDLRNWNIKRNQWE